MSSVKIENPGYAELIPVFRIAGNELPPEIIGEIFEYLRPIDRIRLRGVCRILQSFIEDKYNWNHIHPSIILPFTMLDLDTIFVLHDLELFVKWANIAKVEMITKRVNKYLDIPHKQDPDFLRLYFYKYRDYISDDITAGLFYRVSIRKETEADKQSLKSMRHIINVQRLLELFDRNDLLEQFNPK